jgi:hypothetical protein
MKCADTADEQGPTRITLGSLRAATNYGTRLRIFCEQLVVVRLQERYGSSP